MLAFRCGNNLISEGDSIMKLQEACGQPDRWAMNTMLYKQYKVVYIVTHNDKGLITKIIQEIQP